MKLSIALLASAIAATNADNNDANNDASARFAALRRRLSFEKVAGYGPESQVTDHCAIDLDQRALETQLALKTTESFEAAQRIYQEGAHSKSYAQVTLTSPLTSSVSSGSTILGRNADGNEVGGKAYSTYNSGDEVIKVQYLTTDVQGSYVECQVGALAKEDANFKGCLAENGDITIGGATYSYVYNPDTDNNNGRTIAGFSTGARDKMRSGCKGCPYNDFMYFYNYYGTDDYADQWVQAAFDGTSTQFRNGNGDFSGYSLEGKEQIIKKGTAYLSVFMYVIREFEDALDDCESSCMNCNDGSVHAWDEGVCFYTGSIEGQDGLTDDGKLLHQLADKRCIDYKTCGSDGSSLSGMSRVNYELSDLFTVGQHEITVGNCEAARDVTRKITDLMYIPMIQGSMRYAFKVDKLQGGEKEKAEGAAFAAAVLPRVHAANPNAASTIYNNLRAGASSTDFASVKAAFESVYPDLGITCADIGGLWNDATKDYHVGMEPCGSGDVTTASPASARGASAALAAAFASAFLLVR